MDYDKSEIPAVYDEARALSQEAILSRLDVLSMHVDRETVALIVDLGCGSGRFSEPLADYFGARVIGIDPSEKMLDQARRKLESDRVTFERGSAEAIPVSDGAADMVFMSMVFHHFRDGSMVARECRRILRRGGYTCIRNSTREADFPHRHIFPGLQLLANSELPSRSEIRRIFEAENFATGGHRIINLVVAPNWSSFIYKSSLRADSLLARLPNEDFERGLAKLRAHSPQFNAADPVRGN